MKWITFVIPVFLWGQSFFGNFSSGFISRMGRRNQNQPASSFELRFTGGFNFHGISAGINLYFNSEDKFTPQATSFYSLTPTWRWGRIYIGNFSPSFSPLTLSGINLLGGGVELFPGIFRFFIVSGRIKKASTDSSGLSYERFLWGVRLGLGRLTGTRITLINSKDLSSPASDSVMRAHNIYPQENWVVEVSQKISLFGGKFRISGLGAVTLLTRDITAKGIETEKIPEWVKKNFRINSSSSADYAYRVETSLRLRRLDFNYFHSYSGPGYEPHGVSGHINDRVEDMVRASLSLSSSFHIGATYWVSRDNLIETRNGTSRSENISVYTTISSSRKVVLFTSAVVSNLKKTGDIDTFNIKNRTVSVSSGINFRLSRSLSLNLNGGIADVRTETYLTDMKGRSTSASLSFNHKPSLFFTYSLGYSLTILKTDTLKGTVHSPLISVKFDLCRRVNLGLSAKAGISRGSKTYNFGISGGVKITKRDLISLRLSGIVKEKNKESVEFRAFYSRSFRIGG